MINENLEINVITYNRAAALERTFQQLLDGPFADCKITVLDNCSTDHTPEVCAKYQKLLPDFHIIRHEKNIGLSANYLRAVEISRSLYTWILCDDDSYDWSQCEDVLAVLKEGEVDWICVGAPGQQEWERGLRTTTKSLWKRGCRFFYVHTFFPSIIFKTERFDAECLTLGYFNAVNAYPNHRFVSKALEQNFSEYVSQHTIVTRDPDITVHLGLHWLTIAFNSSATIPDPRVRRLALYEATATRWQWLKMIGENLFLAKLSTRENSAKVPRQFLQLFLACVGEQRLRLLLLSPLVIVPSSIFRLVRDARRRVLGRTHGDTDLDTRVNKEDTSNDASVDFFRG